MNIMRVVGTFTYEAQHYMYARAGAHTAIALVSMRSLLSASGFLITLYTCNSFLFSSPSIPLVLCQSHDQPLLARTHGAPLLLADSLWVDEIKSYLTDLKYAYTQSTEAIGQQ
jgi:hypothetical protein